MSDNQNPLQVVFKAYETFTQCIQSHLSHFIGDTHNPSPQNQRSITSISSSSKATISDGDPKLLQPKEDFAKGKSARPLTKEELGRATWTLLHTLAAQFPDNPTRQQKRDVKELMAILSRIYPCKECADHFKEVLNSNPVQAGSHAEFSQWLCHVHNVVNRSLGKLVFPCQRVDARWGKLECEERACDLEGSTQTLFCSPRAPKKMFYVRDQPKGSSLYTVISSDMLFPCEGLMSTIQTDHLLGDLWASWTVALSMSAWYPTLYWNFHVNRSS